MGVKFGVVIVIMASCMVSDIAWANQDWSSVAGNWNHSSGHGDFRHINTSCAQGSKKVVVGGSQNWRFGYNYTDWAIKNGPIFLNDTLVFKYDPPNDTTFPHSVYLLPDFRSFQKCDLTRAKKVGGVNQGGGQGFEFVLRRWQPHYFVCGEGNGIHCKVGLMKFAVWPLIPWYY